MCFHLWFIIVFSLAFRCSLCHWPYGYIRTLIMNNLTTTIMIFVRFPATACPCKHHIQRIPSAWAASSWSRTSEGLHDEASGAGRRHEGVLGLLFASGIVRHSFHVCQVHVRSLSPYGNISLSPQKKKDAENTRLLPTCTLRLLLSRSIYLTCSSDPCGSFFGTYYRTAFLSVRFQTSNNTNIISAHTHTHTYTHTDCAVFAETGMNNMIFRAF